MGFSNDGHAFRFGRGVRSRQPTRWQFIVLQAGLAQKRQKTFCEKPNQKVAASANKGVISPGFLREIPVSWRLPAGKIAVHRLGPHGAKKQKLRRAKKNEKVEGRDDRDGHSFRVLRIIAGFSRCDRGKPPVFVQRNLRREQVCAIIRRYALR